MSKEKKAFSSKKIGEVIRSQAHDYKTANKKERGAILDSLEKVTKRPRKSLIRSLNREIKRLPRSGAPPVHKRVAEPRLKKETRGRPRKYTKAVEAALEEIWESYNFICAERLYTQVPIAVSIFRRDRDWQYSNDTTRLLLQMPLGTMKQYLVRMAKDKGLMRGFSTTRSSELLNNVPVYHGNWDDMPVGYGELDTVVHSGPRLEGIMVYTTSFIEMQTYWQEFWAGLDKTAETTKNSISHISQLLPMDLKGIHPDSGDEFINQILYRWCKVRRIDFTRSRPSKKNDNANVEERNRHIVRDYIGYERYDCPEAVVALNKLYMVLRLYVNYFLPIMKVKEKKYLPNGKQIRIYGESMTPYERVLAHPDIPKSVKQKLTEEYGRLNPKKLRARIKALTINLERIQREQGYHFKMDEEQGNN